MAKASVTVGGLEESLPWTPRGPRGRHERKEQQAKARNHSRVAGALPHGVGIAYKPCTAKSRCACEWGGWGRVSDDGSGHYNPDRSEGPWGRATEVARMAVLDRAENCDTERRKSAATGSTKGGCKLVHPKGMPGAGLSGGWIGKAPSEKPTLEPY